MATFTAGAGEQGGQGRVAAGERRMAGSASSESCSSPTSPPRPSARFNERVLLERDASMAALDELLAAVAETGGPGRLVFLGGQAGVGKTTLLGEFGARLTQPIAVRRGNADNITTPAALGVWVEAVPELGEGFRGSATAHRPDLLRHLRSALAPGPAVVVLEDVHWADRASLELLTFVGRRLRDLPALIIATYRSDEVTGRHPLAVVMGDLATAPGVSRMSLEPLSIDGVGQLVRAAGSPVDAGDLFRSTGGNPFYVTEVIAAGGSGLPASVRDAVSARTSRLSAPAAEILTAAAVLGQRVDVTTLVAVSGQTDAAVDECVLSGVLVGDGEGLAFRHEIARVAVEEALLPGLRRDLHARALTTLRGQGSTDDRRLAYHAAGAGDRESTLVHAERAAAQAARRGAHREAAAQYRIALRACPASAEIRPQLLESLSYECYVTDQLTDAIAARQQAMELRELSGDQVAVGTAQRWLSRLSWYLGRGQDSERYAGAAVATLEQVEESPALAMAYSNISQLRMLNDDVDGAVTWGQRAIELARRVDDVEAEIHALNNVGTALGFRPDDVDGRRNLVRSLDLSLAIDASEHAARAYTNLGWRELRNRSFAEADRALRAGIAYCQERDLDSWSLYMSATLARSLAEQGQLVEARHWADDVLAHAHLSPVTAIVALVAAAQVAARRGAPAGHRLEEATTIALDTGESQRLVPVAAATAEVAWLEGRTEDIAGALALVRADGRESHTPWDVGELSWWASRGGISYPTTVPAEHPFRLMIDEAWTEAAELWEQLGSLWWAAVSRAHAPDLESARVGASDLERMGAVAVRDRILRDRRARGLPVPRGPRGPARATPIDGHLSAREMDVLRLLVDGLTDAEIAEQLVLSPRTVGHHVSSLLHKLDEPTRARAVVAAVRRGLVAPT